MSLGPDDRALLAERLQAYVPRLLVRQLADQPSPPALPGLERFGAGVLCADISGFTPLAEQLALEGPAGVEALSQVLNAYFGQLITLVLAQGGDIVKFAGDALLAVWRGEEELAILTQRAAQCALAVQTTLERSPIAGPTRLSLRLGLGAGEVVAARVGGVLERCELLVQGAPIVAASTAQLGAPQGAVVCAPSAWSLLQQRAQGRRLAGGGTLLQALDGALPPPRPSPEPAASSPALGRALRAFVPAAILLRLAAGQSAWLGELRHVSVLFIQLPSLDAEADLSGAQDVLCAIQTGLYRQEGSINKLSVDEKGLALLAAFGLPPLTHEDDAVRAVLAAQAIAQELSALGQRWAIGIASGLAFCGTVGTEQRREYTLLGDVVNGAARLMQRAPGQVLCDAATWELAQSRLGFEPLAPLRLKGKRGLLPVYRPLAQAAPVARRRTPLIGREAELALLTQALERLVEQGEGGCVVVEGEAGIGKTRLVEELARRAQAAEVLVLWGGAEAVEQTSPYHAWRPPLRQLLGLDGVPETRAAQQAQALAALPPELAPLAPLLNAVLPLELAETAQSAPLRGEARAEATQALLLALVRQALGTSGGVLVLEDAHWLDSASWALVLALRRSLPRLLLVLSNRSLPEPWPVEYAALRAAPDTRHLLLGVLTPEETTRLVCQGLGVEQLPAQVERLLAQAGHGHPFFSEELARALLDEGVLRIEEGGARLAPGQEVLLSETVPETVQGVITSRMDRLPPTQQLVLKVASVIGRTFSYRALHAVYPLEADKERLPTHLAALERMGLTRLETSNPEAIYTFKHALTQEVAYQLLLVSQRQQLHRAVAQWYEQRERGELAPVAALLAHHWSQAEEPERAVGYLVLAGEAALRGGAYQEARRFLAEATRLAGPPQDEPARLGRARWLREEGEACIGLGELDAARTRLEGAVALLGWPVPTSRPHLLQSLLRQIGRQVTHRLRASQRLAPDDSPMLEAARAYLRLIQLYYYLNDPLLTIHADLRAANLAEAEGISPELARAFAILCLTSGIIPIRPLAEMYRRLARDIDRRVGRPADRALTFLATALYDVGLGRLEEARRGLEEALAVWDRLGDRRLWLEAMGVITWVTACQGRLIEAAEVAAEFQARHGDDVQLRGLGYLARGATLLPLGQTSEALTWIQTAVGILEESSDDSARFQATAVLALTQLRLGKREEAEQAAEIAAGYAAHFRPTVVYTLEGVSALAEVALTLAEEAAPGDERAQRLKEARIACRRSRSFARVFPIGQPAALRWQGTLEWLEGHPERAHQACTRSLTAAERLGMRHEEGLSHFELGRHATGSTREQHLQRARAIFAEIGATYNLTHTDEVLALPETAFQR